MAEDTTTNQPAAPSRSTLNVWGVLAILIVMAALTTIVWKVVDSYTGSDAVAVLGIIIPMFATIGAAVFGIPIAYQRGTSEGKAQEAANTAPKVDAARKLGNEEKTRQVRPLVESLSSGLDQLEERVRTGTVSPQGARGMFALSMTAPNEAVESLLVPDELFANLRTNLGALSHAVE